MKNSTSPLRTFFLIRNLFFPFITLCLLTVNIPALAADSDKPFPEYRIRAAFIYNFLKFVTWPNTHSSKDKTNVCIIGDGEFARSLPSLKSTVRISIISSVPAGEISSCHILYIGKEEETNAAFIVSRASRHAILTISEARSFADNGGIIEIVRVDKNIGLFSNDKINLRINLKAAKLVGLNIDARLLQIAAEVIK